MKVIFLDIDGVLTGYNKYTEKRNDLYRHLGINHIMNYYDIKRKYVRRLAFIIKCTNAKVVLSSSWKQFWFNDKQGKEIKRLKRLFRYYHIDVIGITPNLPLHYSRTDEIKEWLENYATKYRVENFVILDDELWNFDVAFSDELVLTSKDGCICGHWTDDTGLKIKHVRQAIRILNERKNWKWEI